MSLQSTSYALRFLFRPASSAVRAPGNETGTSYTWSRRVGGPGGQLVECGVEAARSSSRALHYGPIASVESERLKDPGIWIAGHVLKSILYSLHPYIMHSQLEPHSPPLSSGSICSMIILRQARSDLRKFTSAGTSNPSKDEALEGLPLIKYYPKNHDIHTSPKCHQQLSQCHRSSPPPSAQAAAVPPAASAPKSDTPRSCAAPSGPTPSRK